MDVVVVEVDDEEVEVDVDVDEVVDVDVDEVEVEVEVEVVPPEIVSNASTQTKLPPELALRRPAASIASVCAPLDRPLTE